MARNENPPFPRGETFYGTDGTIDTSNYIGTNLEGKEWVFEDIDPRAQSGTTNRTPHYVRCRIVRNVSGTTLYGKYLATFQATAPHYGKRVDGLCDTSGEAAIPLDEYLPSAGVRNGDLCWAVVEGPAKVRTDLAGGASNVINVGDRLVGLTAATSGATTAGRVVTQSLTGATAVLAAQIQGRLGYALSAATTANTNSDLLALITKW